MDGDLGGISDAAKGKHGSRRMDTAVLLENEPDEVSVSAWRRIVDSSIAGAVPCDI